MKLYELKTLHMKNPLGINAKPYFSWKLMSKENSIVQTAYQILVVNGQNETIWDSGKVLSDTTSFIPYEGKSLASQTRYTWKVISWDNLGNMATEEAVFETALLDKNDWKAKWVDSPFPQPKRKKGFGKQGPATYFYKKFELAGNVRYARLYATCHGVYELFINENKVDGRKFAPEHTSYEWFLCYQTYDVAEQLNKGQNTLGMYVGDGWYCGVSCAPKFKGYKPVHSILFQLEVEYEDGTKDRIFSDEDVMAQTGPVLCSDLYFGERYDANKTLEKSRTECKQGKIAAYGTENLYPQLGEPVRTVMEVPCQKVLYTPNGETVLDFGQVVCGAVRMRVEAPQNTHITLEHSEVLDKDGNFTMNIALGMADQVVEYISSGEADIYEPHFSFQGFRYVRVSGMTDVKAEDFIAAVYSTDTENTGNFACSDPRINRLYENTRWSQRANMLSIPTDCPQREKAGWTGDIQVYATTALLNADTTMLLTRWLKSLAAEQKSCGAVPMVIPMQGLYYPTFSLFGHLFGNEGGIGASAGWSDAAVLVPWQMYQVTGNTSIIENQYSSMKKWCDYIIRTSKKKHKRGTGLPRSEEQYLWNSGYHWGEWLIPSLSKNGYGSQVVKSVFASRKYTAPVFAYYSISSMAKMAEVTERMEDAAYYGGVAEKIKDAFKKWISANHGNMPIELMGAYIMPLYFDLVPDEYEKHFEEKLLMLIEQNDYCLDTGFLATPFLFDTLFKIGRKDVALKIFYGEKEPSYFHQLKQGATTIWESWFSYDKEGNPLDVSLNHYAFGCIDDWIFRKFSGMDKDKPGFKHIVIAPEADMGVDWVKRDFKSEHGLIVSEWKKENGRFLLKVEIPCNTTATIKLPNGEEYEVGSGSYEYSCFIG